MLVILFSKTQRIVFLKLSRFKNKIEVFTKVWVGNPESRML